MYAADAILWTFTPPLAYFTSQPLLNEIEALQILRLLKTVVCPIKTKVDTTVFKISSEIYTCADRVYVINCN